RPVLPQCTFESVDVSIQRPKGRNEAAHPSVPVVVPVVMVMMVSVVPGAGGVAPVAFEHARKAVDVALQPPKRTDEVAHPTPVVVVFVVSGGPARAHSRRGRPARVGLARARP